MLLTKLKAGNILVAEPSIVGDFSFQRSIVLLASHDSSGSIGFIMNKPVTYTLSDLIPDITEKYIIYNGGPVEQDNLYFVHNVPDLVPGSIEIAKGLYWGGDFDHVVSLIKKKAIHPNNIKFLLGYSGWSQCQLEDELNSNSWVAVDRDVDDMITDLETDCWREELIELGGDYLLWVNTPDNPSYN